MSEPKADRPDSRQSTAAGCLLRLLWMVFGNIAFVSSLVAIAGRGGALSPGDGVLAAATASLLAVRYLDIRWMNGQTADGRPATMGHWRRYALVLIAAALVLGGAAHGIGWITR
jgi:hypothetical protein